MSLGETPFQPRPHCYRCDKPERACLCAHIERLHNRTPIVIVQHKHESRHPLGTVRIAELGLARSRVHTVPGWAVSDRTPPDWLPAGAGLLYPGPDARPLETLGQGERPRALVVLDGTWHTARALFRDHAWVRDLPRYSLTPPEPSRYRIRREPMPDYVSTIEAIVHALRILEPDLAGSDGLLRAFERLIDVQIQEASQYERTTRLRSQRPRAVRSLPRALVEHFEDLVLVYGEASLPEEGSGLPELVHWTALRIRDLATFDCVVAPRSGSAPSARRLSHLCLDPSDFDRGVTLGELGRRWTEFVDPRDWIAAWNPRTLAHFERALGAALRGIGLKGVYGRVRSQEGDLDRILALEGEQPLSAELVDALGRVRGRARVRLQNALQIALLLRRMALV
jgi:DTW domain-containing protein YfiP